MDNKEMAFWMFVCVCVCGAMGWIITSMVGCQREEFKLQHELKNNVIEQGGVVGPNGIYITFPDKEPKAVEAVQ